MTPRCVGRRGVRCQVLARHSPAPPTSCRVRSGLICCPAAPAGGRLPQHVRREVQRARIDGREQHGHRCARRGSRPCADARGPTFCTWPVRRSYRDTLPPYTMSGSSGSGATYPYSSTPTGCHSRNVICPSSPRLEMHDRSALLLSAADAVGKRVVGGDVIELRGRLVVPGAPRLPAVDRDDGALIGSDRS